MRSTFKICVHYITLFISLGMLQPAFALAPKSEVTQPKFILWEEPMVLRLTSDMVLIDDDLLLTNMLRKEKRIEKRGLAQTNPLLISDEYKQMVRRFIRSRKLPSNLQDILLELYTTPGLIFLTKGSFLEDRYGDFLSLAHERQHRALNLLSDDDKALLEKYVRVLQRVHRASVEPHYSVVKKNKYKEWYSDPNKNWREIIIDMAFQYRGTIVEELRAFRFTWDTWNKEGIDIFHVADLIDQLYGARILTLQQRNVLLRLKDLISRTGTSFVPESHLSQIHAAFATDVIRGVERTIRIDPETAYRIGRLIWWNESNCSVEGLTQWNEGEDFASLGIAHFIWYPEGRRGPFTESFPLLVEFLAEKEVPLPDWLRNSPHCPWSDRDEFLENFQGARMNELRELLHSTMELQVAFAVRRLEKALPQITQGLSEAVRQHVEAQFYRLAQSSGGLGLYILVDYVNFKGEGIAPGERYNGEGWGLLQVLQNMQGGYELHSEALRDFAHSAEHILKRRVSNAPPERREERWLPGWIKRIETYRSYLSVLEENVALQASLGELKRISAAL